MLWLTSQQQMKCCQPILSLKALGITAHTTGHCLTMLATHLFAAARLLVHTRAHRYKSLPLTGVPFDDSNAVLRNEGGVIVDGDGKQG